MFKKTDSKHAPWKIIDSNDKLTARIKSIQYVLNKYNLNFRKEIEKKPPSQKKKEQENLKLRILNI